MNSSETTFGDNIGHLAVEELAEKHPDFRRVLWTGEHSQIVLMTVPVGGEIGDEVHEETDQILSFVRGTGMADLAGETRPIVAGEQCAVPAGTRHNFRNTGDEPLVLYTVYAPPEHAVDAAYATKEEADAAEESGEDRPPSR